MRPRPSSESKAPVPEGKTWEQISKEGGKAVSHQTFKGHAAMAGGNPMMVLDRLDPYQPHSILMPEEDLARANGFVATDSSSIYFAPTKLPPGQYYQKDHEHKVQFFPNARGCPGNVGGFHGTVIDTEQPGSTWDVFLRYCYIGAVTPGDPEFGLRPCIAILTPPGALFRTATNASGRGNETKGLTHVDRLVLPKDTRHIIISDILNDWPSYRGACLDFRVWPHHDHQVGITGLGDGYYGVYVSRNRQGVVRRISVIFQGLCEDINLDKPTLN